MIIDVPLKDIEFELSFHLEAFSAGLPDLWTVFRQPGLFFDQYAVALARGASLERAQTPARR